MEAVEFSRVEISRREDDDRRLRAGAQRGPERVCRDASALVRLDWLYGALTEAEKPQRPVDRDVARRVREDADSRRAEQSIPFDVPSGIAQNARPCSGERRDVRHLAARDERERRVTR